MGLPSHPVLQKLQELDRSLSIFHDQLSNVLYGEEYMRCVTHLEGEDLVWLVGYLDEVLHDLVLFSPAFRKCLRELRSICESTTTLPPSYTLSSHLTVGTELFASGGYGDVYRGTLDGGTVCIKRVRMYSKDDQKKAAKTFCKEAIMWKHLKHPNIVPLLGITISPPQLISRWMPGGDLSENMKNPNVNRRTLLSDVAEGLCYLHSCNVVHGDLKGQNVLVDDTGHARITDFGLAKVTQNMDSIRSASSYHGHTPRWAAPEVLMEGRYSKEADIFSFAMVMIEAYTGAVPFDGKPHTAAMYEIINGVRPPQPTHPNFTAELWTLMQNCWNQIPHLRPEISEVLSVLRGTDSPTWKSLISDTLAAHERVSLLTMIFSDKDQVKLINDLSGGEAQTFVDKIDEVLDLLAPQVHKKCLRYLYRICGSQILLPRSLEIPLCYSLEDNPVYHGGLADVWKGQYGDRKVAAQVFRLVSGDKIEQIRRRFYRVVVSWRALHHPNVLPLLGVTVTKDRLVMASEWMEKGNIMEFIEVQTNVDRLWLLRGVVRGLIYMHDQGIIHGDLKGVNIVIDNDGHSRLTGFDLVTLAPYQLTATPPQMADSTIPWMSPELLYPERFGLKKCCPTKESDCYALGMVIYEVLRGQAPFATYSDPEVVFLVLGGETPERPQGEGGEPFTGEVWGILELCWKPQPSERLSAKGVLMRLNGDLSPPWPPSDVDEDGETDADSRLVAAKHVSGPSIAQGSDESSATQKLGTLKKGGIRDTLKRVRKFFRSQ